MYCLAASIRSTVAGDLHQPQFNLFSNRASFATAVTRSMGIELRLHGPS